jgi:hypothetical protein
MSVKKKPVKVITEAAVRKLIAKERKIWEDERAVREPKLNSVKSLQDAKARGQVLTQMDRFRVHTQSQCDHTKGGYIIRTVRQQDGTKTEKFQFPLQGSGVQYAVLKHQMTHGDIWVRCLRCGKWWKPPIRSQYKQDRDFWRAMFEYEEAVNFPTNNAMSSSVQCKFSVINSDGSWRDGTEIVREKLANSAGY